MKKLKCDTKTIIEMYANGKSFNSIAKTFKTYPTTIKRILERNNVELRHDVPTKGSYTILTDGDKLIKWAKAQNRLVSKIELAKVIGKTRLSPKYFQIYPELGQYVMPYEQKDIQSYSKQLYDWLKKNNISYVPNDRSALGGVPVHAKLLKDYEGILLFIDIRPQTVSVKKYSEMIGRKLKSAKQRNLNIVFIKEAYFEDLDYIKGVLDSLLYSKER